MTLLAEAVPDTICVAAHRGPGRAGGPRLGFGCAGLMARLDRRSSLRLLETAFDSGVTHFDVARSYGYGAAESVVGDFLATHRGQVTVTTKLGILPPRRTPLLSAVKAGARTLAAAHPGLRARLRRRAAGMVQGGAFDLPTARQSLETSLRELRTDHLDLLLLHDCGLEDLRGEELTGFLKRCQREGKVGAYGIATHVPVVQAALRDGTAPGEAVQFPSNAWAPAVDYVGAGPDRAVLTHSAIGPRLGALCARLSADAVMRRHWSEALSLDAGDRAALARLLLGAAMAENARGTVLFSSQHEGNIRANVRAVRDGDAKHTQVAALRRLLAGMKETAAP